MAAKLFSINNLTSETRIDGIEDALNDKFLITTTLYKSSNCLIFSTPLITKVIKIKLSGTNADINISYGDAWTSGETITNSVQFVSSADHSNLNYMQVVADSEYFVILTHTVSPVGVIAYVGALNNGDKILFGFCVKNYGGNSCVNITKNTQMLPISLYTDNNVIDGSGNFYTMPLMWSASGLMQLNGSVPAETLGLKVSSVYSLANTLNGDGYVLSPAPMYMSGAQRIKSSLLIEYAE